MRTGRTLTLVDRFPRHPEQPLTTPSDRQRPQPRPRAFAMSLRAHTRECARALMRYVRVRVRVCGVKRASDPRTQR